jgi:hypothetical protein
MKTGERIIYTSNTQTESKSNGEEGLWETSNSQTSNGRSSPIERNIIVEKESKSKGEKAQKQEKTHFPCIHFQYLKIQKKLNGKRIRQGGFDSVGRIHGNTIRALKYIDRWGPYTSLGSSEFILKDIYRRYMYTQVTVFHVYKSREYYFKKKEVYRRAERGEKTKDTEQGSTWAKWRQTTIRSGCGFWSIPPPLDHTQRKTYWGRSLLLLKG